MVILGAQRLGMFDRVMSALGQKQTYAQAYVRFTPESGLLQCTSRCPRRLRKACAQTNEKRTRTATVSVFASFSVKAQLKRNYCV